MKTQIYHIGVCLSGNNMQMQGQHIVRKGYWVGNKLHLVSKEPVRFYDYHDKGAPRWSSKSHGEVFITVKLFPGTICEIVEPIENLGGIESIVVTLPDPLITVIDMPEGFDMNEHVRKLRKELEGIAC